MRFAHTTGNISYKVLYQHTIYVICLFNISIKANFKQVIQINNVITLRVSVSNRPTSLTCLCTGPCNCRHYRNPVLGKRSVTEFENLRKMLDKTKILLKMALKSQH